MADHDGRICVQICYARPDAHFLEEMVVPAGTTIHEAIKRSGMIERLTEIDLTIFRVGIFGKLKSLDTSLRDRDRVEIYRPLLADPKEARRKRAGKQDKIMPA